MTTSFAEFLHGCSHEDLLGLPLTLMDAEQLRLTMQEIQDRNNIDLKRIKKQIQESR